MEKFALATKNKLRFNTSKGQLNVEDLWDLPLTSDSGQPNLDDLARELHKLIKDGAEVSFVKKDNKHTKAFEVSQLKFDLVKFIIDVKLEEAEAVKKTRAAREKNQRILELIAKKDDETLASKSRDELLAMLHAEEVEE